MQTKNVQRRRWRLSQLLVVMLLASTGLATRAGVRPVEQMINPPQLISPANGVHTTGNPADPDTGRQLYEPLGIPTFAWQDLGATKYELEVATTEAFGADRVLYLANLSYPTFTPTNDGETAPGFSLDEDTLGNFTDQATFFWHVRAWDDVLGQWSDYSSTWSFTRHWGYRPQLLSPEDNSVQDLTPQFEWEPVLGAAFYQIQIDTSDSFGDLLVDTTTDVPAYTPSSGFPNDDDIFWRVRAFHRPNDNYGGPWSETRQFKLAWSSKIDFGTGDDVDHRPLLLTPPENANYINRPLFCWQPVAGAKKYKIDLAWHPEFVAGTTVFLGRETEGTCYAFPKDGTVQLELGETYYWRVWAVDYNSNNGQLTSIGGVARQFTVSPSEPPIVPTLFYPPYYYPPIMPDTFEDRTVAVPTFIWDHVSGAGTYELCIDDDDPMDCTGTTAIVVRTANAGFTFTDTNTYPLQDGQVYYWKVRADVPDKPDWDSMRNRWKTRIDRGLATADDAVHLIQPTYQVEGWSNGARYGQDSATYYPVFAWTATAPLGEATYQIQIAHDPDFTNRVHDAQTDFTEYTPLQRPEPGTYYWRVRRVAPGQGAWGDTGRFTVSRNFTGVPSPILVPGEGIVVDGLSDDWPMYQVPFYAPAGEGTDAASPYNLDGYYVASDSYNWYFGVPISTAVKLGIYFDADHFDERGATQPPADQGDNPGTPAAHQPEFAVYWSNDTLPQGKLWAWDGASWDYAGTLDYLGGSVAYDDAAGFLEMAIPVGNVSTHYYKGSLSIMMLALDGAGTIRDRLPNLPGAPDQSAFLTESTVPTPLLPANAPSDPALGRIERDTPVLTWRHNEVGPYIASSNFFQTFKDDTLTTLYESENGNCPKGGTFFGSYTHWAPLVHYSDNNSYNWTIQRGGFTESASNHFRKAGFVPVNLQFSPYILTGTITYTNRTPSFSWQPAQAAARYQWELYAGGKTVQNKTTVLPYYTPQTAVPDDSYTWKVWAVDARGNLTAEAAQGAFRKVSDPVDLLPAEVGNRRLVLRWEPAPYATDYKVFIADDPGFSTTWSDTTYNTTFTPTSMPRQTTDGAFYVRILWRDNKGNESPWRELRFGHFVYLPVAIR